MKYPTTLNQKQVAALNKRKAAANNPNRKRGLSGEDLLQSQICRTLDFVRLPYFSIPNGSNKTYAAQRVFSATGLKAGVPDLFIPRPYMGDNIPRAGCFIEVKNGDKGKVTPLQTAWHDKLRAEGYGVFVVRTLEQLYTLLVTIYPEESKRIRNINQLVLKWQNQQI